MSDTIVTLPPILSKEVYSQSSLSEVVDWGLKMVGIPDAWKVTKGKGIVVGVADTGIDTTHPDLVDNILDVKDFSGSQSGPEDRAGHGAHVSSTIAASDNNSGIIGVAPQSKLVVAKVLGDSGQGMGSWVARGIDWLVSKDVDIISMSLGSPDPDSEIMAAVQRAIVAGKFVICAAGNDGNRGGVNSINYPARWGITVAVAAVDKKGNVCDFSSRGPEVDIAAPGQDILGCWPKSKYARISGTCLSEDTQIYTTEGPKLLKNIQIGDTVYAQKDGKCVPRIVQHNWDQGVNTVHRLISGGRDVLATETHQFLAVDKKRRDLDWVKLCDLTENHRLLIPSGLETHINPYLDSTLSDEFCWILGFFLGDGWVSDTNRSSRVCFAVKEQTWKNDKLSEYWSKCFGKLLKTTKYGWSYDDNTKVALFIRTLGLDYGSTEKTIPDWVWGVSHSKQMAFYEGYCAADGHRYKEKGRNRTCPDSFECMSSSLIRKMACLMDYNGWQHGATSERTRLLQAPNMKAPKNCTSYTLKGSKLNRVGGWSCLDTVRSTNGHRYNQKGESIAVAMGIDTKAFTLATWRIITEVDKLKVRDITVPDADCFIAQGLVAHNSMATPFVAGVTALMVARHRELGEVTKTPLTNMHELKEHLKRTASGNGKHDSNRGWGIIDPNKMLSEEASVTPSPPPPPQSPPGSPPVPPKATPSFVIPNVLLDGKAGKLIWVAK